MRSSYFLLTCLSTCIYTEIFKVFAFIAKVLRWKYWKKIHLQADIRVDWSNKMSIFTEIPTVKRQERYWRIHWNSYFILIIIIAHKIAGWILLFFFVKNIKSNFSAYVQSFPSLLLVIQNEAEWHILVHVLHITPVNNISKLVFIISAINAV
jgi:hypothetical protein